MDGEDDRGDRAYYDAQDAPYGKAYRWNPGHDVLLEEDNGERLSFESLTEFRRAATRGTPTCQGQRRSTDAQEMGSRPLAPGVLRVGAGEPFAPRRRLLARDRGPEIMQMVGKPAAARPPSDHRGWPTPHGGPPARRVPCRRPAALLPGRPGLLRGARAGAQGSPSGGPRGKARNASSEWENDPAGCYNPPLARCRSGRNGRRRRRCAGRPRTRPRSKPRYRGL